MWCGDWSHITNKAPGPHQSLLLSIKFYHQPREPPTRNCLFSKYHLANGAFFLLILYSYQDVYKTYYNRAPPSSCDFSPTRHEREERHGNKPRKWCNVLEIRGRFGTTSSDGILQLNFKTLKFPYHSLSLPFSKNSNFKIPQFFLF